MMEAKNKVSIWVGKVKSEQELNKIMYEEYSDDGEVNSIFMENFKIDYIDNQFQEVFFYNSNLTKNEIFNGFSYIHSFIDQLPELKWTDYNCVILLYNYDYKEKIKESKGISYINCFDYIED